MSRQIPKSSALLLSNVGVRVPVLTLHIILLDQSITSPSVSHTQHSFHGREYLLLNIPPNISLIQNAPTPRRPDNLHNQLVMTDLLPALHDPHDRRLRLIVSISSYTLMCLLVLLFRLFELDLVDLDAHLGVAEGGVER